MTKNGKENGLILELVQPKGRNNYSFSKNLGAAVFISNNTRFSFDSEIEIDIGKQTNIAVSKVITQRLSAPYSGCVDSLESSKSVFAAVFADNNASYSQLDCFNFCWQRKLVDVCGCYDFAYNVLKYDKKPCLNFEQIKCMFYLSSNISNKLISNCSEDCPEECFFLKYSNSISSSSYPSEVLNF